jgi:hypothetical protein
MNNNQPSSKPYDSQCFYSLLRYVFLSTLLLTTLSGCHIFQNTPQAISVPDQSTPEAAVQSLLKAFNERDVEAVEQLIEPTDKSNQLILEGLIKAIDIGATMEVSQIEITLAENTGEMARVNASFHQVLRIENEVVSDEPSGGMYTLIRKDGKWYFIGLGQFPPPGWVKE